MKRDSYEFILDAVRLGAWISNKEVFGDPVVGAVVWQQGLEALEEASLCWPGGIYEAYDGQLNGFAIFMAIY